MARSGGGEEHQRPLVSRGGQHRSRAEPGIGGHGSGRAPRGRCARAPLGPRQNPRSWLGDATPESIVLRVGIVIVGLFMALTALDVGGRAGLWVNAHWTAAGCLAALYAALVARKATGPDRRIAILVAVGTLAWLIGQFAWITQTAIGYFSVPAPSDLGFLMVAPPIVAAFIVAVNGRLAESREGRGLPRCRGHLPDAHRDHPRDLREPGRRGRHVGAGRDRLPGRPPGGRGRGPRGPAGRSGLAARRGLRPARSDSRVLGFAWVDWLRQAVEAIPPAGSIGNYAFSVGMILVGFGARDWRLGEGRSAAVPPGLGRGPRRPAAGGAAGQRGALDAVEPGDERVRSDQALLARGHPPRRRPPVAPRPRARPPARRLARLAHRPRDRPRSSAPRRTRATRPSSSASPPPSTSTSPTRASPTAAISPT